MHNISLVNLDVIFVKRLLVVPLHDMEVCLHLISKMLRAEKENPKPWDPVQSAAQLGLEGWRPLCDLLLMRPAMANVQLSLREVQLLSASACSSGSHRVVRSQIREDKVDDRHLKWCVSREAPRSPSII